ncbi:MAG: hypothetical protein ACM3SW_11920 [Actinomycetota bacterium]
MNGTRSLILQDAGHTVVAATDELEVVTACETYAFSVAVIGQSASRSRKHALASLIRKHCPSAGILELFSAYEGRILNDADAWLEISPTSPRELAERVNELARRNGTVSE